MLIGFYRETNHNGVEERGIIDRDFACFEVVADIELKLIRASLHRLIVEQRLLGAPVTVRHCAYTQLAHISKRKQAYVYTHGRTAVSRIEDMCCESSHSAPFRPLDELREGLIIRC